MKERGWMWVAQVSHTGLEQLEKEEGREEGISKKPDTSDTCGMNPPPQPRPSEREKACSITCPLRPSIQPAKQSAACWSLVLRVRNTSKCPAPRLIFQPTCWNGPLNMEAITLRNRCLSGQLMAAEQKHWKPRDCLCVFALPEKVKNKKNLISFYNQMLKCY